MVEYTRQDEDDLSRELVEMSRRDILAFTCYTKDDYAINWHHLRLADALNRFVFGDPEYQYLMVLMPPRHGKSELVSRRLPPFIHGIYPDDEIMAASYLDSLAGDMTMDIQKIMDSKEYKNVFPATRIWPPGTPYSKGTRNSTEHTIVGCRGKYRGQGVGGSFTGKGANWILVDDPIKGREIADSVAFRERLWNFYNNDLFSRRETRLDTGRRGRVLITLTRWHEDDLAGRLLELQRKDPEAVRWKVIEFPAIKVDDTNPDDPRAIGEALWPEKYSIPELNQIRATIGPRAWSSLYQQSPRPDGGGLFTESMFDFVDMPPADQWDYSFIMGDTAYKDGQENDFTVLTAFGVKNEELFIRDVWRARIKARDIEDPATRFITGFHSFSFRGAYIEPKGHGLYLNQVLPGRGVMMPSETQVKEFFSDRRMDKVQRANNAIPHLTRRKVHINRALHNKEELVSEALSFPNGAHDDFVDTLIDGVKYVYNRSVGILDVCGGPSHVRRR